MLDLAQRLPPVPWELGKNFTAPVIVKKQSGPAIPNPCKHRYPFRRRELHLKVLERAGLIRRERRGRVHALRLEIAPLRAAGGWIEQYQRFWRAQLSALDLYLKEMKKKEKS